jgi:lactoylglutathione lyase
MRYLHTMIRVADLDASLKFYVGVFGLTEIRRLENDSGRFTLVFLAAPGDTLTGPETRRSPLLELTYNWDAESYASGRNFGHLAYEVENIYAFCQHLREQGITINRPPRDGNMAFVKSPDGISIEILQIGAPLPPAEPWLSIPNEGSW